MVLLAACEDMEEAKEGRGAVRASGGDEGCGGECEEACAEGSESASKAVAESNDSAVISFGCDPWSQISV